MSGGFTGSLSLVAFGIAGVILCGCGDGAPATPQTTEARLRGEFGVPPAAARVLILSQSSHLDWDWLHTFDDYFQRAVDRIFTDAAASRRHRLRLAGTRRVGNPRTLDAEHVLPRRHDRPLSGARVTREAPSARPSGQ